MSDNDSETGLLESGSSAETAVKRFPCGQCGAKLTFHPGSAKLRCEYCQFENLIPQSEEDIEELDYRSFLETLADSEDRVESATVHCNSCGASTSLDEKTTASQCPFCGSDLIVAESRRLIRPRSVLPFAVERVKAWQAFRKWIASLWFAPNQLKKCVRTESDLNGLYVPYWTYDASTTSHYSGSRGDDYWTTETYTDQGKTKTRSVRRTRWRSVSGVVWNTFDDVLVVASHSLPHEIADKLEPWDLENLEPYTEEFLSGFRAESYQVELPEGLETARPYSWVKIILVALVVAGIAGAIIYFVQEGQGR